jgi:hypothetical protein
MARDFPGIPFSSLPEPSAPDFTNRLRNILGTIHHWAQDQSQAMARVAAGEVPSGAGGASGGGVIGVTDHGLLSGLGDDDHAQYPLLAGRAGGQSLIGGTAVTDNLTLKPSTATSGGNSSVVVQSTQNVTTDKVFRVKDSGANDVLTINSGGGISIIDPTSYSSGSPTMLELNANTASNGASSIKSRFNSQLAWSLSLNGTQVFMNGSMTSSVAAPAGAGMSFGQWVSAGTSKGPAFSVSNAAQFDISGLTTAARTYVVPDTSSTLVVVGNAASAAGVLGRIALTAQTGNLAAQTMLTGGAGTAGMYRLAFYIKCTTAGTPAVAKTKVTVSWNDGTAQTVDVPFLSGVLAPFVDADLGTLNAFAQGAVTIKAAASQNITFTTTGTYTGSPQYSLDARIEALG